MSARALPALKYAWNELKYRLDRDLQRRNQAFVESCPDPYPLPPPRLAFKVRWLYDLEDHWRSGILGQAVIARVLADVDIDVSQFRAMLDFGCGCGRILRHWRVPPSVKLYGIDYDPELIAWCNERLDGLAEFSRCASYPPVGHATGSMDFIYAASVFTHMDATQQLAWMGELHRLLRPGGHLLITTMGEGRKAQLTRAERRRFEIGEMVCRRSSLRGTACCGAFHPLNYVCRHLVQGYTLLEFLPGGMLDHGQDIYLMRRELASPVQPCLA